MQESGTSNWFSETYAALLIERNTHFVRQQAQYYHILTKLLQKDSLLNEVFQCRVQNIPFPSSSKRRPSSQSISCKTINCAFLIHDHVHLWNRDALFEKVVQAILHGAGQTLHFFLGHRIPVRTSTLYVNFWLVYTFPNLWDSKPVSYFGLTHAVIPVSKDCIVLVVFGGRKCTKPIISGGNIFRLSMSAE